VTTATAAAVATREVVAATREVVAATATAQSVQATATIQAMHLERERRLDPLRTYGPWFIGLGLMTLLIGLGSWTLVTAMKAWDARQRVIPHGPYGRPLVLLDGPGGRRTILDPSRLFGPVITIDGETATMPQLASPELQNQTTARSQAVELRQAAHPPYPIILPPAAPRRVQPPIVAPDLLPPPSEPDLALPTDAPWDVLRQQWRGGGLPLGLGVNGLLLADPEAHPHLLMAGTSGSGKTRFGLRPIIASALSSGWQVVVYDRSGLDFLAFQRHPNAHIVLLDNPAEAIAHLFLLYELIQQRFVVLRQAEVSTWGRLPHPPAPRVLAVMDEFSNLADSLQPRDREELWRGARMVAAEGRKAGVHLALALQDPTHKSMDLRIRRNCLPLSFRVQDDSASRVVLGAGGAESLAPRHFLTVMEKLVEGVAFAPSDNEIRSFLESRPTTRHPDPEWLEGEVVAVRSSNRAVQSSNRADSPTPERDMTEQIRALLADNWSLRAIQQELFGYTGGAAYEAVKAVQAQMRANGAGRF
jgi:hypothetical protein